MEAFDGHPGERGWAVNLLAVDDVVGSSNLHSEADEHVFHFLVDGNHWGRSRHSGDDGHCELDKSSSSRHYVLCSSVVVGHSVSGQWLMLSLICNVTTQVIQKTHG